MAPWHDADKLLSVLPADLSELSLGSTMRTTFPDPDNILKFTLTIEPDEGMYRGGSFNFTFDINQNFPHDPPKVLCQEKIYHPNIDLEGKVCLNILREDWKPVLNLNAVIVGLQVSLAARSGGGGALIHFPEGVRSAEMPQWLTIGRLAGPTVSLPRTERLGSPQQGGGRRPAEQPGRLQAQRAHGHGWRLCPEAELRPRAEVSEWCRKRCGSSGWNCRPAADTLGCRHGAWRRTDRQDRPGWACCIRIRTGMGYGPITTRRTYRYEHLAAL